MGKTKNATKPLTQEEVWDDSALVRSWDEAVEEYKLYHSVNAKGENVEDVLREANAEEAGGGAGYDEQQGHEQRMETDIETPAVVPPAIPVKSEPDAGQETAQPQQPSQENPTPGTGTGAAPASAIPMPPVLSSDEGLKNLMMAWYFAGYYTGLYEGQQKANQNANP